MRVFLELLAFRGAERVLHLTWFAFFLVFVLWFGYAPLLPSIRADLGLSATEVAGLMIFNVALTAPARLLVGMLVDRVGPRRTYAALLVFGGLAAFAFAAAQSYAQLAAARLAMSLVGAGFVVGIRMIGEWFPKERVGLAEGVYGGFGNSGSAAAALLLPGLALLLGGGTVGWRFAIATCGVIAILYGLAYLRLVQDAPAGRSFRQARRGGVLGVADERALRLYFVILLPVYFALALVGLRLKMLGLLPEPAYWAGLLLLTALCAWDAHRIRRAQKPEPPTPRPDPVDIRIVGLLALAYFVAFGSELAVVSFLPSHFVDLYGLPEVTAGILASAFAVTNLVARPLGGYLADQGDRHLVLTLTLLGIAASYVLLARLDPAWPLPVAYLFIFGASLFVMAAEGAIFAWVPRVQPRATGQIAGIVGGYGNIGAIVFLSLYPLLGASDLFLAIALAAAAVVALLAQTARSPAPVLAPQAAEGRE